MKLRLSVSNLIRKRKSIRIVYFYNITVSEVLRSGISIQVYATLSQMRPIDNINLKDVLYTHLGLSHEEA